MPPDLLQKVEQVRTETPQVERKSFRNQTARAEPHSHKPYGSSDRRRASVPALTVRYASPLLDQDQPIQLRTPQQPARYGSSRNGTAEARFDPVQHQPPDHR